MFRHAKLFDSTTGEVRPGTTVVTCGATWRAQTSSMQRTIIMAANTETSTSRIGVSSPDRSSMRIHSGPATTKCDPYMAVPNVSATARFP